MKPKTTKGGRTMKDARSKYRILAVSAIAALMLCLTAGLSSAGTVELPQTGQTTSYATGDDGDLKKGAAWPNPRFTDNSNGTVTDNLTGLVWLKNANCFGTRTWANALNDANTLASGACGLTDGSTAGQWRLPNVNELESLVHAEEADSPTWLNTQGFSNVQSNWYWSSTTYASNTDYAWIVGMWDGNVIGDGKGGSHYVWPVRSGGGAPDLIVSSLSAVLRTYGTPVIRGVGANYVAANQGSADAAASCLDLYLSRDTVINAGDVYIGRQNIPALLAGDSYGRFAGFTLPSNKWQVASGTWRVIGVADACNNNDESDETNNQTSTVAGIAVK